MSEQRVDDTRGGVFWMHDTIIDRYAREIGVYGVAVYGLLCRRANAQNRCWPSFAGMCRDLGISRRKLLYTLDDLENRGLIRRSKRDPEVRHSTNVYTLLPVENGVHEVHPPGAHGAPPPVHEVHPKEYTEEGLHIEGVAGNVTYLDSVTRRCLPLLKEIKNFPRDEGHVSKKLRQYREEWPGVDAVEVCKDYREWCEEKRKAKPSLLQLRNFFKQAAKDTRPVAAGGPMGRRNLDG